MIPLILLAALLGAPLFCVFGALALWSYGRLDLDPSIIISELSRLSTMPLLRALPMFSLAGYVLGASGAPQRLLQVARAFSGWVPGGVAVAGLIACVLMTSFTGASGMMLVALGGVLLPMLTREGYRERFALGLLTSGGNVGVLFAPSIPVILFSIIAQPFAPGLTAERLYRAALIPGLLTLTLLTAWTIAASRYQEIQRHPFSWRELARAAWAARWELPLPVVVLGSIYLGLLAVSEAAVLTAAYVLVVEVVIQREISLRRLATLMRDSAALVGGVMVILGLGMALTNAVVDQHIPEKVVEWAGNTFAHPVWFLLALNGVLLVTGCLMDIYTATIVLVPLLLPLAERFGISPIHLGVIFLANLEIGYSTPPVGMNLFIAALRLNQPLLRLARASLPWLAWLIAALLLITYVPSLSVR